MPHVWNPPPAIALYFWPPRTPDGVARLSVAPLPSSPSTLYPQQRAVPELLTAQVWAPPAARALKLSLEETALGCGVLVVELLPSWPKSFQPQQKILPELFRPQL